MIPLSKRIAKLEQRLNKRLERWKAKHSADWRLYAVLGGMGWYFYGSVSGSPSTWKAISQASGW